MKNLERSTKTPPSAILNLIEESVRSGGSPYDVCSRLGWKKNRLNYYVSGLKRANRIKQVGYGTWELVQNSPPKQVQNNPIGTFQGNPQKICTSGKSDSIRSHAYQWTLKLPKIYKWFNRIEYLNKKEISFEPIQKNTQRIIFKGHKTWLSDKTITIYIKKGKSYCSDDPYDAYELALQDFLNTINGLERLLNTSFRINKLYQYKCDKKHHSLIKNALARDYNQRKTKLKVVDDTGCWMTIDDSFHLDEAEFPRNKTNNEETKIVQNFFNSLKDKPFTAHDFFKIADSHALVLGVQEAYAEQIKRHLVVQDKTLDAMEGINKGLDKQAKVQKQFVETMDDQKKTMKGIRKNLGVQRKTFKALDQQSRDLKAIRRSLRKKPTWWGRIWKR